LFCARNSYVSEVSIFDYKFNYKTYFNRVCCICELPIISSIICNGHSYWLLTATELSCNSCDNTILTSLLCCYLLYYQCFYSSLLFTAARNWRRLLEGRGGWSSGVVSLYSGGGSWHAPSLYSLGYSAGEIRKLGLYHQFSCSFI